MTNSGQPQTNRSGRLPGEVSAAMELAGSHTVVGKVIPEPCGGPGVPCRKTQVRFGRRSVKLTL